MSAIANSNRSTELCQADRPVARLTIASSQMRISSAHVSSLKCQSNAVDEASSTLHRHRPGGVHGSVLIQHSWSDIGGGRKLIRRHPLYGLRLLSVSPHMACGPIAN